MEIKYQKIFFFLPRIQKAHTFALRLRSKDFLHRVPFKTKLSVEDGEVNQDYVRRIHKKEVENI